MLRLLLILLLLPFNSFAGSDQLFGQWNSLFINGKFAKDSPWVYYSEFSERNSQTKPNAQGVQDFVMTQLVTYDAIGYKFNDSHTLYAGFWYQYTQPPYSGTYVNEANAFQQYNFTKMFSDNKLSTRSRLEERNNLSPTANGTSVRYRQQVKFVYALDKDWSLVGSEEIFFNLNTVSWGPVSGFDQNRVFVGGGYNINKTLRTEIGYMNQFVNKNLKSDFIDHQLSMNLYVNIPD